jgi:hypothetical protein
MRYERFLALGSGMVTCGTAACSVSTTCHPKEARIEERVRTEGEVGPGINLTRRGPRLLLIESPPQTKVRKGNITTKEY